MAQFVDPVKRRRILIGGGPSSGQIMQKPTGGQVRNYALVLCTLLVWRESMFAGFSDPFEALLTLQRALDARIASDWMGRGTAAIGSFPPINMFQKGDDYVAIIELPGIDKND